MVCFQLFQRNFNIYVELRPWYNESSHSALPRKVDWLLYNHYICVPNDDIEIVGAQVFQNLTVTYVKL
jgi:hypothetical protein